MSYEYPLADLAAMAAKRKSTLNERASNPKLVEMELLAHQVTCKEYSIDILRHLIQLEHQNRPSVSSFDSQPEITVQMRSLIFDFIMCCHTRLGLSSSTLFLCFNITDRYCSRIIVKSSAYQLLALSALWLASKYTDKKPRIPSLKALQSLCCNQYTKAQFREMELHILNSLNWSVCSAPSHDSFIDILLKNKISSLDYKGLNLNGIKYGAILLCELSCFDQELGFNYNASAIALAAVTLMTHALRFTLEANFQHYSVNVKDANLHKVCELLLAKFRSGNFPSSFRLKYFARGKLESNPVLSSLVQYDLELSPAHSNLNACAALRSSTTCVATPTASTHASRTSSMVVPPTPSTPSTARNKLQSSKEVATTPPDSCATSPFEDISVGTKPVLFKREHMKRDSSAMDIDFFEEAPVGYKRMH